MQTNPLTPTIEELLAVGALQKLKGGMNQIMALWQGMLQLADNGDSAQLDLLKIATVFQIFFIDTLASGNTAKDLTEEDWNAIAEKVLCYAVMEEDQRYSEFVFGLYADYIDLSITVLSPSVRQERIDAVADISKTIRSNTQALRNGTLKETAYVEANLWLSLEAMIKLLALSLSGVIGPEYAELAESIAQFAFEYGRYVLFAKEQALLEGYLQNQNHLDEELEHQYERYIVEVQAQADQFRGLIEDAFSPDIQNRLRHSAALAREAGVPQEEILETIEDVDDFFL